MGGKMNGGEEYKEITIMAVSYQPSPGGCEGCYYQSKEYVAAGDKQDPCNLCVEDYIFEKSVRLEKIK
jgi:hypothetical protein